MLLRRENLTLRAAVPEDAELLCRWWNDGRLMIWVGYPLGLKTTPERVWRELAACVDDTFRILIMEVGGLAIGEMNYRLLDNETASIGIKVCETDWRGRGFGGSFLRLLIDCLFRDFNRQKIILATDPNNAPARRLYEKLGFKPTRFRYHSWQNQIGEWRSSVDYELCRADYSLFGVSCLI